MTAIKRADFPLPDLSDPLTAPFFTAAARGELAVPRCGVCDAWCWYPAARCRACDADALVWTATSGRGRLFSWAVVQRPFLAAFEERVPFVTALVALEDDPAVRIVGTVLDTEPGALVADMALVATFRPLSFPTVPDRSVTVPVWAPT